MQKWKEAADSTGKCSRGSTEMKPKEMKANWDPETKDRGKSGKGMMSSEQQQRKIVLAAAFE